VCRKHDGRPFGHLIEFLDEDGAFFFKALDHEAIMDNFVTHVDGRTEFRQSALDDLDGAVHARAESARCSQKYSKPFF